MRSYRIVDQVPEQALARLFRCAPFMGLIRSYTGQVMIGITRVPTT